MTTHDQASIHLIEIITVLLHRSHTHIKTEQSQNKCELRCGSGHICIYWPMYLFSDNAANFYNLANANGTQISKEYKLQGSWYNKEMGRKDVFINGSRHTKRQERHTRFFSFLLFLVCHQTQE